jgi:hypothetical protein
MRVFFGGVLSGFLAMVMWGCGLNTIAPREAISTIPRTLHSMKTVHKSVLIWYSAEEMFALVTDVARYPQFLPWCDHAAVLKPTLAA